MKIKVLATGSAGNSYAIIDNEGNALVIEAWMNPHSVIANFAEEKTVNFSGWCYSHKHSDHFVANIAKQYDLYFGEEITDFSVFSFPVKHDQKHPSFECNGFVIQTVCKKTILYVTDFYEISESVINSLSELNYDCIMIEVSYNNFIFKDLEQEKQAQLRNHCSDDNALKYVKMICGEKKNTQILTIHKSGRGGRAGLILSKFSAAGFNNVRVAVKGTTLNLN